MLMRTLMCGLLLTVSGCSIGFGTDRFTFEDVPDGGPDATVTDNDGGRDAGPDASLPSLAAPILRFPPNGHMTGSVHTGALAGPTNALRPRLRWEPQAAAERYEVEMSSFCQADTRATCAFDSAVAGTTTDTDWRPDAALPVSMTRPVGRRYYWRVRACAGTECSEWSEVRYVNVGRMRWDFDGDGYGEVFAASATGIIVYRGPDLSPLAAPISETSGVPASGFAETAGDVNGDGFSDLIVFQGGGGARSATLYFGGLANLLGMGVEILPDCAGCVGGADLNGDGFDDVVCGRPLAAAGAGEVDVLLGGNVGLTPLPPTWVSPAPTPERGNFGARLVAGDLDGDGFADVAVAAAGESGGGVSESGRVYVHLSDGASPSSTASLTLTSGNPTIRSFFGVYMAIGDINDDGFADLLSFPIFNEERAYWFAGARSPSVAPGAEIDLGRLQRPFDPILGDFDGDGVDDLLLGGERPTTEPERNSPWLFLGSTDGPPSSPTQVIRPPASNTDVTAFGLYAIGPSDVDGDGREEVLVPGSRLFLLGWSDADGTLVLEADAALP